MTREQAEQLNADVLTVDQLIDALRRCPGNLPVVATWEGIYQRVEFRDCENGVVVLDAEAGDPFEEDES